MSDDKKRLILSTALDTFLKYGYKRVSMNEIAEAAGISRPGLYLHFRSKEEVFSAAILQYADAILEEIQKNLASHKTPEDKLMYVFEVWAIRRFDLSLKSPEAKEIGDSYFTFAREAMETSYEKFAGVLAGILKAHAKATGSKKPLSADKLAHLLTSALRGFKLVAKNSGELRKLIQELVTLVLAG